MLIVNDREQGNYFLTLSYLKFVRCCQLPSDITNFIDIHKILSIIFIIQGVSTIHRQAGMTVTDLRKRTVFFDESQLFLRQNPMENIFEVAKFKFCFKLSLKLDRNQSLFELEFPKYRNWNRSSETSSIVRIYNCLHSQKTLRTPLLLIFKEK